MTRDENISAIRATCIKANPEKDWRSFKYGKLPIVPNNPRLADVLLAIRKHYNSYFSGKQSSEESVEIDDLVNCHWDLEADDLTLQSDACVAFLTDLLK